MSFEGQGPMQAYVEGVRERLADIRQVARLNEYDMWTSHGPVLWRAEAFLGNPVFYPVYRLGDLYSYSPLALILTKGFVRFDAELAKQCDAPGFRFLSGRGVLDRDIERLGGPVMSERRIVASSAYVDRIVAALLSDVTMVERANPEHTNIVLCGGKDSLNLLLLPWRNPVYAASAPPNYALVKQFVEDNELDVRVVPLHDVADDALLDAEVIENGCRNNLEHCRWGGDLRALSRKHDGKVIFWKGQIGDALMTPHWKEVGRCPDSLYEKGRKAYRRAEKLLPVFARTTVGHRFLEPSFRRILWERCAMWQGAHVSLIRAVADCLVLSAYHGPEMAKATAEVDLTRAVLTDLRDEVGARLLGRPVKYPDTNPGPPVSTLRSNRSSPALYLDLLRSAGVDVIG